MPGLAARGYFRLEPIDHENTERYTGVLPYKKYVFHARLQQGLNGFFFPGEEGYVAGYDWWCEGRDYFEPFYGWTFRLKADEVYIFDAYVHPTSRGGTGLFQGFSRLVELAQERNISTFYTAVAVRNEPAWRFQVHLGFEAFSCLEVTRFFRRPVRARQVAYRPHLPEGYEEAAARQAQRRAGGR